VTTQVPTPTPVIIPDVGVMVSTVGHALDHVPPGGVATRVIKFPVHTTVGPLIAGVGCTVTSFIDGPVPKRWNFMVSTPAATAVAAPVTGLIVIIDGNELIQIPLSHIVV
jgi:hypothetical protein